METLARNIQRNSYLPFVLARLYANIGRFGIYIGTATFDISDAIYYGIFNQ